MMVRKLTGLAGLVLFIIFLLLSWQLFDLHQLLERLHVVIVHPGWLFFMFVIYVLSFVLKAAAWQAYTGREHAIGLYLHGIFYSLLFNHLLPIKVGDLVRTGILMKKTRMRWDSALHTVVIMRLTDLFVLGIISAFGMLWLGMAIPWLAFTIMAALLSVAGVALKWFPIQRWSFASRHWEQLRAVVMSRKGPYILGLVAVSWILEAVILLGIIRMGNIQLSAASTVWANSVTIGGQIFHVTPGGIGTYESTLSGSLAVLGVSWEEAYASALLTHAFKFAVAFILGSYSLIRMPIGLSEAKEWIQISRKPSIKTNHACERKLL